VQFFPWSVLQLLTLLIKTSKGKLLIKVISGKKIILLKAVSRMVHFHPFLTAKLLKLPILIFDLIYDLENVSLFRPDCVKMRTSVIK